MKTPAPEGRSPSTSAAGGDAWFDNSKFYSATAIKIQIAGGAMSNY
jgi:hypothetical protein